ncbi:MAG TPA: HPr(Ser) kinase/phosphatase [Candidatus Faecousia intestinigallinarum]|nr:HPr(Ser) kinase/phosphatase [Candidatus Faecousia intestinigallinarum]
MAQSYCVPLTELVEKFHLEVIYAATDYESIRLTVEDVARPGLQLAGYFDHFEPMRLQVVGNVEISFLLKLTSAERTIIFDRFFSYKCPALLIARNMEPLPECLEMAKKHNVTLLHSPEATSTIVSAIIAYLKSALAPRIVRHGVMMEIYGEGVLILGESGLGKSEAAVELVKRGHRLVADDAVEIRKISEGSLMASAPEIVRNFVELRGIGIVNVAQLFGAGAVRREAEINLVVNIVPWNHGEAYDRMGVETQYMEILDSKIPMNTIPITPGRNLAVILEVAAMNNRQRKMGYNPGLEFTRQLDQHMERETQRHLPL